MLFKNRAKAISMPNITMAGKTDKNFTFIVLPNTSIVKLLEKKVHKWELKSELNIDFWDTNLKCIATVALVCGF